MHLDAEHHLRAQHEKQRWSAFLGTSSHPYTTCMLHILSPPLSYQNLRTHSLLASEPIQLSPMQFIDNHVFNSHHLVADLPLQIRVLLFWTNFSWSYFSSSIFSYWPMCAESLQCDPIPLSTKSTRIFKTLNWLSTWLQCNCTTISGFLSSFGFPWSWN